MTIPGLKVLALILTAGQMLCVVTGSPGAQATVVDSALVPGRRIRVFEIAPPGRIPYRIGSLVAMGPDSLAFRWRVTDELVQLPLDSVKRLDISLGRRGNYAREGAITAFAATFVGIIVIVGAASAESGGTYARPINGGVYCGCAARRISGRVGRHTRAEGGALAPSPPAQTREMKDVFFRVLP